MFQLFNYDTGLIYTIEKEDRFPDGTLHLTLPHGNIDSIIWDYENDAELFTLICIRKHYSKPMRLIIPYLPNARMDRVKNKSDVFTLKYFCDIINSLNFFEVAVLDPHSNVSLALLDNVAVIPFIQPFYIAYSDFIKDFKEEDTIIFFPDEGAMKRYASDIGKPYAFGMKNRDWETGKILNLEIINKEFVKDKNVLIVDDICSRGGTFLHSANALYEAGAASVSLYITHAENTMVSGEMYNSNLIRKIYTANTIFDKSKDFKNLVTVVEW